GGVGSKGRKGFGSLAARGPDLPTALDRCEADAGELRRHLGRTASFQPDLAESPAISDPERQLRELSVLGADPMELVGCAYLKVAARFGHDAGKAAWGLPRKIHGPMDHPLGHQRADTHQPPEWLDFPRRSADTTPQNARHASPLHLHVAQGKEAG